MHWTFDDERPIYTQLVEQVERAIVSGEMPPGHKLPGVRKMAAEAGVNPNTMQRALAGLAAGGLVQAQRTSGCFVTSDEGRIAVLRGQLARGLAQDFVKKMRALGCQRDEIDSLVRQAQDEPAVEVEEETT